MFICIFNIATIAGGDNIIDSKVELGKRIV
jgi:hypothetical protein